MRTPDHPTRAKDGRRPGRAGRGSPGVGASVPKYTPRRGGREEAVYWTGPYDGPPQVTSLHQPEHQLARAADPDISPHPTVVGNIVCDGVVQNACTVLCSTTLCRYVSVAQLSPQEVMSRMSGVVV